MPEDIKSKVKAIASAASDDPKVAAWLSGVEAGVNLANLSAEKTEEPTEE